MAAQASGRPPIRAAATALGIALLTFTGGAVAASRARSAPIFFAEPLDASSSPGLAQPDVSEEREEFSSALADFQGGEMALVGGSALGVVLLVLVLIVLL